MARKRFTFSVEDFKQRVNGMIASEGMTPEERNVVSVLLEQVLMDTGNYRGFGYLELGCDESKRVYY